MKEHQSKDRPFLDEGGIVITRTHLSGNGHTIAFAKIKSVRINKNWTLLDTLLRRPRKYVLVVSTGVEAAPVTICETGDAAFMERIEKAMDLAAAKAGGTRMP